MEMTQPAAGKEEQNPTQSITVLLAALVEAEVEAGWRQSLIWKSSAVQFSCSAQMPITVSQGPVLPRLARFPSSE